MNIYIYTYILYDTDIEVSKNWIYIMCRIKANKKNHVISHHVLHLITAVAHGRGKNQSDLVFHIPLGLD